MTDIEDFVQKDRDFLHDLCNSLAVAQGHLMLINMKMKRTRKILIMKRLN